MLARRSLLGAAAYAVLAPSAHARTDRTTKLGDLGRLLPRPVVIESMQLLRVGEDFIVRVRADDGSVGYAVTNQHASYLVEMFKQRVVEYFIGKDARPVESLVDGVYVHGRNYKLVGVPLWCCVSWAELAVLDLLGRMTGKPAGELVGGPRIRDDVPMYLSSTDRETTPEQEVATFEAALARTGARAVKYKVGGRMSGNADASQGRTETLIALMRKRLGDQITFYADANGSFDVRRGIEVGRMLEAHGVAIYEEPCPFEDYASTRKVTAALKKILVAGGEQDTSFYRYQDIVRDRVVDLVQPDVGYNGGLVRTTRVARLAAAARMAISPHCPQASTLLYTLQLASFTPNLGPFQEFHLRYVDAPPWYAPELVLREGRLRIPTAPGLGLTIEEARIAKATVV